MTSPTDGTYELRKQIKKEEQRLEEERRIAKLDSIAKAIPVSNLRENLVAYEELEKLVPDEQRYREKVRFYKDKIERSKWKVTKQNEDDDVIFVFANPGPSLEIHEYEISISSANRVLDFLDLPQVVHAGKNVEHFWYQDKPIGSGRLYRTEYRWTEYYGGMLTFERRKHGCGTGNKSYDCLEKVILDASTRLPTE